VAKFPIDKARICLSLLPLLMSQPEQKLTSPASLAVDAILVVGFFFYMYWVLASHVPSNDPKWIMIWGGLSASLMAALFWLALQMFRVVFRFQREQNAAKRRK
jgi:protein-S-isoprenylcysteine O-methyltransferase Ste14